MAETKKITSLYVVTDSETSYDNIGDIDGGLFEEEWLERYIKNHGPQKLIMRLVEMQTNIMNVHYKIEREKDAEQWFGCSETVNELIIK